MIKTRNKLTLIIILSLVVAVSLILIFATYTLTHNGNKDIEKYRAEEIHRLKQTLKDAVDMAHAVIDTNYKNAMTKAYLEKQYGPRLKSVIDIAETILNTKAEAVKNGEISLSEAQQQAAAEIKQIRYNNGKGYIWVTDTHLPYPKMIMHPLNPSLEGQILDDSKYNCALGKGYNLFTAGVEMCQAHGKGFVDYLWPKNIKTTVIPDVPKLAYVKLFSEWNWTIATALYVDNAIIDAIEKSKDDIRKIKYDNGVGYFWLTNATKTDLKIIVHPTMSLFEGQILEGKLKKLFEYFVDISEQQNGSGFLDYTWPKQTVSGMTEEVSKLAYVRLYEPLGWIIGTDIYIDGVDQAVAEKQELVKQQLTFFIIKIVGVSLLIIVLIATLIQLMNRYLFKVIAQPSSITDSQETHFKDSKPTSAVTPQSMPVSNKENPAIAIEQEIPVLTPISGETKLYTDDCIRMVQEISKTLITEHAKLLATAIHKSAPSNHLEVNEEIKQLTNKSHQTIEEVKKKVATKQQQVFEDMSSTAPMAPSNSVMGDLNQMVGNRDHSLKI